MNCNRQRWAVAQKQSARAKIAAAMAADDAAKEHNAAHHRAIAEIAAWQNRPIVRAGEEFEDLWIAAGFRVTP